MEIRNLRISISVGDLEDQKVYQLSEYNKLDSLEEFFAALEELYVNAGAAKDYAAMFFLPDFRNTESEQVFLGMAIYKAEQSREEFVADVEELLDHVTNEFLHDFYDIPMDVDRYENVKIKRLFGNYDVNLDLHRKGNILIGANGIGKSTIIKIINSFHNYDLISIISTPFESIDYTFTDEANDLYFQDGMLVQYHLKYEDLLPAIKYTIDEFKKACREKIVEYEKRHTKRIEIVRPTGESDEEVLINNFKKMLDEIVESGLYGQFVYSMYSKKAPSARLRGIINRWIPINILSEYSFIKRSTKVIFMALAGSEVEKRESEMFNYYCDEQHPVVYVDFVSGITLENESVKQSEWRNKYLDWLIDEDIRYVVVDSETIPILGRTLGNKYGISYVIDQNHDQIDEMSSVVFRARPFIKTAVNDEEFVKKARTLVYSDDNVWNSSVGSLNGYYDKNAFPLNELERLVGEKTINLNRIIYQNYYSADFILGINNEASKYIRDFDQIKRSLEEKDIHELSDIYHLYLREFIDKYMTDYSNYLKPILIRNSFFYIKTEELTNPNTIDYYSEEALQSDEFGIDEEINGQDSFIKKELIEDISYLSSLIEYTKTVMPKLKDDTNVNAQIIQYALLLKKYMVNKRIELCPSGIKIYDSRTVDIELGKMTMYERDEIDLTMISSGEKKILIIIALAVFYSGITFMLDEPELSLSLVWQQMIMPDLIRNGDNNYVVATHSPYIAEDNDVREYIVYVPQGGE